MIERKPHMANNREEMEALVQEGLARLTLARSEALYLPEEWTRNPDEQPTTEFEAIRLDEL